MHAVPLLTYVRDQTETSTSGIAIDLRQRPYSIRTRIKTFGVAALRLLLFSQRPYSIRTRIKTDQPEVF